MSKNKITHRNPEKQIFKKAILTYGTGKKIIIRHSLHRCGHTLREVEKEWREQGSDRTAESLANFINNLNIPGVFGMTEERYQNELKVTEKIEEVRRQIEEEDNE